MTEAKQYRRRIIVVIYLSIVIHLYFMLIANLVFENRLSELVYGRPEQTRKQIALEEIMIHTVIEDEAPEEGLISENANPNSAPEVAEEEPEYNVINPEMSPVEAEGEIAEQEGAETPPTEASEEMMTIPKPENFSIADTKSTVMQTVAQGEEESAETEGGDPTTTFYDPEEEMVVRMNSEGRISIPTIPEEYAEYFYAMGETIADTWMDFFPQFQYYMGILKSGDIQIYIQLDKEGNVVATEVVESFGYGVLDESLRNAVNYSGGFGPVPEDLPPNFSAELEPTAIERGDIGVVFQYVFIAEYKKEETLSQN